MKNKFRITVISILLIFIVLIAVNMLSFKEKDDIRITEICVKNVNCAYDDYGEYGADYIEIYNNSNHKTNLLGYGISDRKDKCKYTIGNITLDAKESLIIWCDSNEDETYKYKASYTPRDLHQGEFSIRAGEHIFLSKNNVELAEISLPEEIESEKVYGSCLEYLDYYEVCDPTPYYVPEINSFSSKRIVSLESPIFSIYGGWKTEPVQLELSSSEGDIYYTLDGTVPDENSIKYEGPILINNNSNNENIYSSINNVSLVNSYVPDNPVDKGTVVKAICILNGKSSAIESNTFFIGLNNKNEYKNLSVIEITINPDDFFDYNSGIYVVGNVYDRYKSKFKSDYLQEEDVYKYANYAKEGKGWERPANIEYFDKNHNMVFKQDIGIRIHGGWSTAYNQKSFNLYAREEYDGNNIFSYDFFDKKSNELTLRNGGFRDLYCTKIRDCLNQELVNDRKIGIQQYEPCAVFINGEYWGLYNLQEKICESYISETFNVDPNNVVIIKNNEASIDGELELYERIINFALKNDLSKQENYRYIEEQIDIQSYIDYMSFQIYVANCDSIANNFAMWRCLNKEDSQYGDCKWRFLPYDTDDSDGMVSSLSNYDVDSFINGHWTKNPIGENGDDLFKALLENEVFKQRFVTSFMDISNNNFKYERVKKILEEKADTYRYGVIASQRRFRGYYQIPQYNCPYAYDGVYSEDVFNKDIEVIDDFFKNRFAYIVDYMKNDLNLSGDLYEITIKGNEKCVVTLNTISNINKEWNGKYYSDYPIEISCFVNEDEKFIGWKNEKGEIISTNKTISINLEKDIVLEPIIE